MKVGDLVRMKYIMFWAAKSNKWINYTPVPGVVIQGTDEPYGMIEVLIGSTKRRGMASEWEHVK